MSAAERMREAAAKACIALRDKWEADESHAPAAGAHICAAEILALPLPAPTPVEEAERAVVEYAVRRWSHAAALGSEALDHIERQDDAHLVQAVADLLAARQQERAENGGPHVQQV